MSKLATYREYYNLRRLVRLANLCIKAGLISTDEKNIVDRYVKGESQREISESLNVSNSRICQIIQGVIMRGEAIESATIHSDAFKAN